MTDQKQDDTLNDTVDAVLADGAAPSSGDAETDALARLASRLRGMPSPEFKSQLAAELFPDGEARGLPFSRRNKMLNTIRRVAGRRITGPLALGAVAAAAATIAVLLADPFGGSGGLTDRAEAFGTLPVPANATSAAVPPGDGTGKITYELMPGVVLPDSAPAFRLAMPQVTQARVEAIGYALGITGAAEPIDDGKGGVAGYRIGAARDCKFVEPRAEVCAPSFDMWRAGWFSYQGGDYTEQTTAVDQAQAIAVVQEWITRSGLTNGDAFDLAVEPPPDFPDKPKLDGVEEPSIVFPTGVIVQPRGHSGPNNGPLIQVSVGGDGNILSAGGFWARIVDESAYRLHSVEELQADLQALRGTFADLSDSREGISADVSRDAVATVANVSLTYSQAAPEGDESPDEIYLVPVFVLKVSLEQDGQDAGGLATWVPATDRPAESPLP